MPKKKKEHRSAPGIGTIYQGAKLGVQLVGGPAHSILVEKSTENAITRVTGRDGNFAYAQGTAVALLDQWGSKKIGHAAALSRKSLTALIPEALVISDAVQGGGRNPIDMVSLANDQFSGYSIRDNSFDLNRVRKYGIAKYGLGIARKAINKTRIAEPVKRFLSLFGGSI